MVNKTSVHPAGGLGVISGLVVIYVASVVLTIVALALLAEFAPGQATSEAWGHAIVVAIFAVILPLRLRAARTGRARALKAVGAIAALLAAVNLAEAAIPGFVPFWMEVAMLGTAALTAAIAITSLRRAS